jgi:hypothetical protein
MARKTAGIEPSTSKRALPRNEVDLIAGEDISTKQLRKNLNNEVTALEKGEKVA